MYTFTRLALPATVIVLWWWQHAATAARVASNPRVSIDVIIAALYLPFSIWWGTLGILTGDWPDTAVQIVVAALCARILWLWWRRRRKGKPSRVLGLVRELGGKLRVVAVPVGEGGRG